MTYQLAVLTQPEEAQLAKLGEEVHYPDSNEHQAVTYFTRLWGILSSSHSRLITFDSQYPANGADRTRMDGGARAFRVGTTDYRTLFHYEAKAANVSSAAMDQLMRQTERNCKNALEKYPDLAFVYAVAQWGTAFRFFRMQRSPNHQLFCLLGQTGNGKETYARFMPTIRQCLEYFLNAPPFQWNPAASAPTVASTSMPAVVGKLNVLPTSSNAGVTYVGKTQSSTFKIDAEKDLRIDVRHSVFIVKLNCYLFHEDKRAFYHFAEISGETAVWVIDQPPDQSRVFTYPHTGAYLIWNKSSKALSGPSQ